MAVDVTATTAKLRWETDLDTVDEYIILYAAEDGENFSWNLQIYNTITRSCDPTPQYEH